MQNYAQFPKKTSPVRANDDTIIHQSAIERLFPAVEDSSRLTIACRRHDYSAVAIARAVEDCDAHLLNLNVTSDSSAGDDTVIVELRVSHRDAMACARSLERYGFRVIDTLSGSDAGAVALADRVNELIHIFQV